MDGSTLNNSVFFTINAVAKEVGVVPATIRNWEKEGLISIRRAENGYRIFTLQDIEFLKKIKQKSKDENIGINALRMLTPLPHMLDSHAQDITSPQSSVPKSLLGSKWKECRLKHNYSLEDVAEQVGISASYLSKIENAQANASYEILQRLADFYRENLLFYLNDPSEESLIVKKGEGESFQIGIEGLTVQSLIKRRNHTLSVILYTIEPGSEKNDNSAHSGEEFVYVLRGKVEFILGGDRSYMLSAGDSISYRSATTHRWKSRSNQVSTLLWVYTPLEKL